MRMRSGFSLALVGLALGAVAAAVGLPARGLSNTAFAGLFHGSTDTTGFIHMAIDCDIMAAGTQDDCDVWQSAGMRDVAVTLSNSTGATTNFAFFVFSVRADETRLDPRPPASGPQASGMNKNPDANQALLTPPWSCLGPPPPSEDGDPDPDVAESSITCGQGSTSIMLPSGPTHLTLAAVHYDVLPNLGTATVELINVGVYDDMGAEILSCNPVNEIAGLCFPATIEITETNPDDIDGDGVANMMDNCPSTPNPSQMNSDRNFISNAPFYVIHDNTRANSDGLGDVCDADDDNDGLDDSVETALPSAGCPAASAPTDPLVFDTDGDRYGDGAECPRGANPASASSSPTLASCGTMEDPDGDRLGNRLENCHYNTNSAVADTDGDGIRDGCEAVSINGDGIVNSTDQLLIGQEYNRTFFGGQMNPNMDLNKDGKINSAEKLMLGWLITPMGQCP